MIKKKIYKNPRKPLPKSWRRLYRKGEKIPEEIKGRGMWRQYGSEILFSPNSGCFEPDLTEYTFKCKKCGWLGFQDMVERNEYHCPMCKAWVGLEEIGIKLNGSQKTMEAFF